jgi:hypothetical protein
MTPGSFEGATYGGISKPCHGELRPADRAQVLGLFGPVGPLIVAVIVAMTQHAGNGSFAMNNGIEVPLLYLAGGLVLAVSGSGRYSLDAALGLQALHTPEVVTTVIAVAVVGGLGAIALRRAGADARAG